jgi:N-acetylmuramate 1-kinase
MTARDDQTGSGLPAAVDAALRRLVERATGAPPSSVTAMPGGASTRRYLRVATSSGSAVAMFVPDAAPEEVTNGKATGRWPFLEVRELLERREVRVPRVFAEDTANGLVLLEDLTDETLGAFLLRSPARREEVYRLAVTDLARAQRALAELPPGSVVSSRAFDEKLLRWELLDHFREFGLDARGLGLGPEDRARFDAIADRLAARIASWPRGFVHRDYQSRNLMVSDVPGRLQLTWIDFQDALLGPRVYDLVALLNDSYQSFDHAFTEARLDEYAAEAGLDAAARQEIGREFDVCTVQRKLKDAGRFVFIDQVKNNPSFLPFIEPSLRKVRAALGRLGDEDDMRDLAKLVGSLRT